MKRQLPLIVVAVTAVIVMGVKFIDFGDFGAATIKELDTWSQVTYEFAFLLGAINLTRLHYGNVSRRRPKWVYLSLIHISASIIQYLKLLSLRPVSEFLRAG